jgi:hypothetical protein
MNKLKINIYILLIFIFLLAYIFTLPIDLIDIDTAQFGEVTPKKDFFNKYKRNKIKNRVYLIQLHAK